MLVGQLTFGTHQSRLPQISSLVACAVGFESILSVSKVVLVVEGQFLSFLFCEFEGGPVDDFCVFFEGLGVGLELNIFSVSDLPGALGDGFEMLG